MKLKNIAAATVVAASLIGLAGCSNNAGKTADGKTQVVVWHNIPLLVTVRSSGRVLLLIL